MENRTHAIVVGLFILLLGFGLLFSFWWMNGTHKALNYYTVIAKQPVIGLVAESVVKYRGVAMGKVVNIEVSPEVKTTIYIKVRMPADMPLSKQTYAELLPQGVTGLAYINLTDPGATGDLLQDGDTIELHPSMLDALMQRGPILLDQVQQLLVATKQTVETANKMMQAMDMQTINHTLSNVEKASQALPPLLNATQTTVEKVGTLASEKNQQQLRQTLSSVQKTAESFQPLLTELNATAVEYRNLASDMKQGSHVLTETVAEDTLPELHLLTQSMRQDMSALGQLIESIEENPQSLIFGNPVVQPGPGEAGFKAPLAR